MSSRRRICHPRLLWQPIAVGVMEQPPSPHLPPPQALTLPERTSPKEQFGRSGWWVDRGRRGGGLALRPAVEV
jgi:hypothetical protein